MIKETDLKIISALRQNSRQTLRSISRQTRIPVSTVYDRIKRHEKNIIKKHTSILDFPKIGYSIRLNVLLKTGDMGNLQDFILKNKNINSAFRIDGEFDFAIDCIFREMGEMRSFIEELNRFVLKKQAHFITDEIVRENFLNMEG